MLFFSRLVDHPFLTFLAKVSTVAAAFSLLFGFFVYWRSTHARLDAHYYMKFTEELGGAAPKSKAEVVLILRNLSARPTAVVDFQLCDAAGEIQNGHGYGGKVSLPRSMGPWSADQVQFDLLPNDDHKELRLVLKDVDGNTLEAKRGLP